MVIIIKHFSLERKDNSDFFYVRCKEISHCPYCDNGFDVIGSRKRILCKQDGSVIHLIIRRLKCTNCHKISHELPDLVVPYKRHESDTIAAVLTDTSSIEEDCCPVEESTMHRWKLWFFLLHTYLEGAVRALMVMWRCESFVILPLYPLRRQADGWLKILVRNLVNSGRWLHTRSA